MNYYRIIVAAMFILVTCCANIALAGTFLDTVNEKVNESKDTKTEKDKKDQKEHHDDNEHYQASSSGNSGNFFSGLFQIFFNSTSPHKLGVGYSSFVIPVTNATPMSGWNFYWAPIYIEPIAISIQGYFLTGSVGNIPMTMTPAIIEGEYHGALTDEAGFYAGIGYAGTSGTVGTTTTQDSGWVFEGGLEYKITPYIIANAGYKNIGIAGGSLSGINGGLSLVF